MFYLHTARVRRSGGWNDVSVLKAHRSRRPGAAVLALATCAAAAAMGCIIPIGTNNIPGAMTDDGGIVLDAAIPTGKWNIVTGNMAGIPSSCGSLSLVRAKPDEDVVIAGVFGVGLFASRGGSTNWQQLGTASGSTMISSGFTSAAFDPVHTNVFWETGTHASGPVKTTDDGNSFVLLGGGSITNNDLVSVDFSDVDRKTILIGSHETGQTLWKSVDGGATWTNIGAALPMTGNCTTPLVQNSMTYLIGCNGYGGGPAGVFRTTDGGASWKQMTGGGGANPPLVASDGSIYWNSPGTGGIVRSTDQGLNWSQVAGPGILNIFAGPPVELPGGGIAIMGEQYVLLSTDHGQSWKPVTSALPVNPKEELHGMTYSSFQRAFYVWHYICGNGGVLPVLPDAVMRYDYDYASAGGDGGAAADGGG
jgi:photosystem II stability/assembly factor-like uncharacterized protein